MSEQIAPSVLEQMAATPEPVMPRAARFARACEAAMGRALDHPVTVQGSGQAAGRAGALVADLPDGALVLLLDAAPLGAGALLVPPELAGGIVELLTFGRLAQGAVAVRPPTATDAALLEPVVNAMLDHLAAPPDPCAAVLPKLCFGALLPPAHFARVMPEGVLHELWADLSLGPMRSGRMRLILPPDPPEETVPQPDPAQWRAAIFDNVQQAQVSLQVVLGRCTLSLADAAALTVGGQFELALDALDHADLCLPDGTRLGGGRVGRLGGMRALRLDDTGAGQAEGALVSTPVPAAGGAVTTTQSDPVGGGAAGGKPAARP